MQITCANCKTPYNLTVEQIRGLSYSILPCNICNKFIKITTCPHCNSFYSITFSSANQSKYRLTCEKCAKSFEIEFPVIKEAARAVEKKPLHEPAKETISFVKKFFTAEKMTAPAQAAPPRDRDGITSRSVKASDVTLDSLFSMCASSFTVRKLGTASIATVASFLVFTAGNWLLHQIFDPGNLAGFELIKSMLNIVPFAVILFLYIMTAAVIARMTMDSVTSAPQSSRQGMGEFIARAFVPVFLANILVFIIIDLVFILFGRIPVIGPVLFALLFLPIYLTSLCAVILLAIGFWFYPPVIAASVPGSRSPVRALFRFIREQNFSLAYTIPLMSIVTAVTFAAIYLLHYGSLSLSLFLSKTVLGDEDLKVFSSIPSSFLRLSDLAITGSDSGLYKSLVSDLLVAHSIGGSIIGIIFSMISIVLLASFISITATLSTHFYLMLEKKSGMDDSAKVRLLALLVLILLGVFLIKKIFI